MEVLRVVLRYLHQMVGGESGEDPERGDVPGWVLITLMTAALVAAIWAVAGTRLVQIFNEAMDRVSVI
ncbi:MAG: hypothetical protein L0H81_00990 [Actinomyces sp.]|nr:hypothetical protein [Actinomyces sp.]MDN6429096.1 hypothetical protein [Propionibacterium sp.]MDN6565748.1 hypothetical protein [Actinomyces sp.]MDN6794147.1 hypothetical protein [Propionibacterium sp.]